MYISSNGYLVVPEYNIKYLIDFNESNIPLMPEASETSVRVAGRDGDVTLSTTYEPIPFEIVCYTEDNLSQEEKVVEEDKVKALLNSIKSSTKKFALESSEKFYNVKYNGNAIKNNFPKHLKFSIPLKSSSPYALDVTEREEQGNANFDSNTIKDCGCEFIIEGPATTPKISLNDYQMEYDSSLLEGSKLIIDSSRSTITHINSLDVRTNAMRYYNHQFPKIKSGRNELRVISGIDNESQVKILWRDLKI